VPGILQRYVLLELLRVFALALTAITGILVMAGIVAEASQQGLGPEQILKLLPLLIPETLPYTIPATTLFAVSVVYGRLSNDNEITAIKAAGIPISKVLWPALWIGLAVSGGVYALYVDFIPRCHHLLRTTPLKDLEEIMYMRLRRDLSFCEPKCNYEIFVKAVQGRRLLGATFKRRDANGNFEIVAQAKEAELHVDLETRQINVEMWNGEIQKNGGETSGNFEHEEIYVQMPDIDKDRPMRARERTNWEILEREEEVLAKEQQLQMSIQEQEQRIRNADPADRKREQDGLEGLRFRRAFVMKELWELRTEYATRPALSLGCFFFVLIGCPVAIWFQRRDYLSAFVTCFLPIIVVYYPLIMLGINLGKEGRVLPQYIMWAGDGVMGLVGMFLLWRLGRH
jgi:lipopolysaccharide export system permease protein